MESNVFYDSLRSLGPLDVMDIPDALALQIAATGTVNADQDQIKNVIATYSRLAATSTREEFQAIITDPNMPSALGIGSEGMEMAESGSRSCCGHTCEGTCTPSR